MTRHAWFPTSDCDEGCVHPPRSRAGRSRIAVRVAKIVLVVAILALAAPVAWRVSPDRRYRFTRWSARRMLWALGATVVVDDQRRAAVPDHVPVGGLIVANHVSYLDILAIATITPARFVAKSEVLGMPGFVRLARRLGVIGVHRESLRQLPQTIERVTEVLRAGDAVAVFPEGTTWCGAAAGRFRPAFFTAAHAAGAPIMPMTVGYREADELHCSSPAFIGDDSPQETLRRILAVRALTITLTAHPVVLPTPDRRADALVTQAAILGESWEVRAPMRSRTDRGIFSSESGERVGPLNQGELIR